MAEGTAEAHLSGSLRDSLASAAGVMDGLRAAVVITDLTGRLLYVNPHAQRTYGWSDDTLASTLGRPAADLAGGELDPATMAEIGTALAAGENWEGEFELIRGDGSQITVHAVESGLHDENRRLVGVVSVVLDVTERAESVQRLRRETETLRFLLEVSTVLSSSLDFEDCLQRLARLAVPALGDVCFIDLLVGDSIRRVAATHADPARTSLMEEIRARPPLRHGAHPAVRVMNSGVSELMPDITPEYLRGVVRDEEHYEVAKQVGARSYMCAPLAAWGRILGALSLVATEPGRRFGPEDLALAEDLAGRAGLVIDNARLLSERTRVARALQAALLPPTLPEIPGIELAARYVAAGEGNEVGGDLYDVFDVGRGAWALAVGDVSGRGPEAAAVTGLVRHAFRASGLRARDPAKMLHTANALLYEQSHQNDELFCTACCSIIRPGETVRVTAAAAGHPPPVVIRASGAVEELACRGGLLGFGPEVALRPQRITLQRGDRMLLFTDGLTEARDPCGEQFGDASLAAALASTPGPGVDTLADHLLDTVSRFTGQRPTDDLALLVIGVTA